MTTTDHAQCQCSNLALAGYSPVSYFEKGRAELGSSQHAVEHGGKTYYLASAKQAEAFRADPQMYLPLHGESCAYGVSIGKSLPVDPTSFKIENGRLLLFLKNDEVDARQLWEEQQGQHCSPAADGCQAC